MPYITRRIPYYEVLDEEGLATIEHNADTILEETGIDFRDDTEALELFRAAGCDVKGERVHFPRGLARKIVQATAPREFTQYARNPARNVRDRRQERRCSPPPTVRRSCATSTKAAATPPSTTSRTS